MPSRLLTPFTGGSTISSGTFAGVYLNAFWVNAGLASDEMSSQEIFSPLLGPDLQF